MKRTWRAVHENWRIRLGRSVYHNDGSIRRSVLVAGIVVITIPVLLFAAMTARRFIGRGEEQASKKKSPPVVQEKAVAKAPQQAGGGAGAVSAGPDVVQSRAGRIPEVSASFRVAARALTLARDPRSVAAWQRLNDWDSKSFTDLDQCWYAVALCENGSLAKGNALVNWLLARLPNNADVQAAAGRCAFLRGEGEAAEVYFERAVELGGDRQRFKEGTLQNLLLMDGAGGDSQAAAAEGRGKQADGEAGTGEGDEEVVAELRADASRMTLKGDRSAREAWKKLFQSHPGRVMDEDRGWYAVALCENGLLEEGTMLARLLLADSPGSADLQAAAGRCAFLQGQREQARRHLERALELQPGHREGKRWLGEFAGEFARRSVDRGRRPVVGAGVGAVGSAAEGARLRADALALLAQDDPHSIVVWERFLRMHLEEFSDIDRCWYAVSLCENGMLFEGGELIDILVHRLAESADMHAAAGRCAFLRGKEQEAWWHLSRALELDPEHAHAGRWFKRMASTNVLAPVFLATPGRENR